MTESSLGGGSQTITMNASQWITGILAAALLAFAGCGKSNKPAAQDATPSARFAQFREAFQTPTPEQQPSIAKVSMGIRYRMYPDAVAALEQLSGDASLNDTQKTAVNNLIAALKQLAASPSAPPK